jgi:hypothetical protein
VIGNGKHSSLLRFFIKTAAKSSIVQTRETAQRIVIKLQKRFMYYKKCFSSELMMGYDKLGCLFLTIVADEYSILSSIVRTLILQ